MRLCLASIVLLSVAVPALAQPAMTTPAPDPAPAPPEPPAQADRHGFTAELGLGAGLLTSSTGGSSNVTLAGPAIGLGGWLTPRLAMTFRVAGIELSESGTSAHSLDAFVGPSLQYWIDPHVWIGGGVGVALLHSLSDGCSITDVGSTCQAAGLGFDLRAGYAFPINRHHAVDVSVEVTPGIFGVASSTTLVGFAVLAGYQFR